MSVAKRLITRTCLNLTLYIHFLSCLKMSCVLPRRFNRDDVGAAGCGTVFSGLISVFVFDIFQNRSGCIKIGGGYIAPLSPVLRTSLAFLVRTVKDYIKLQFQRYSVFISEMDADCIIGYQQVYMHWTQTLLDKNSNILSVQSEIRVEFPSLNATLLNT